MLTERVIMKKRLLHCIKAFGILFAMMNYLMIQTNAETVLIGIDDIQSTEATDWKSID